MNEEYFQVTVMVHWKNGINRDYNTIKGSNTFITLIFYVLMTSTIKFHHVLLYDIAFLGYFGYQTDFFKYHFILIAVFSILYYLSFVTSTEQ